jgi:hypothetical protein
VKALLYIFNAREMTEALESYRKLDIDLLWATGYVPHENALVHSHAVGTLGRQYDVILNVSDDTVVSQEALDLVLGLLEAGHPAATAWCKIFMDKETVNVCKSPLKGEFPHHLHYDFYLRDEVLGYPDPVVPTHFMGMSVTGMPVELWRRFPHDCYPTKDGRGKSSDYHLCWRLRKAGIPMVTHRDAEVIHLKRRRSDPLFQEQPFLPGLGRTAPRFTHDPVEARSMDAFVEWLDKPKEAITV